MVAMIITGDDDNDSAGGDEGVGDGDDVWDVAMSRPIPW